MTTNQKYYAVKQGRTIGIYYSWDDCKKQVDGFSNAQYKSFHSINDANRYLNKSDKNVIIKKNMLESTKTAKGGYTERQIDFLCKTLNIPNGKGWKRRALGKKVSLETFRQYVLLSKNKAAIDEFCNKDFDDNDYESIIPEYNVRIIAESLVRESKDLSETAIAVLVIENNQIMAEFHGCYDNGSSKNKATLTTLLKALQYVDDKYKNENSIAIELQDNVVKKYFTEFCPILCITKTPSFKAVIK